MKNTAVKAEQKTNFDVGCARAIIISTAITVATLILIIHMHMVITQ
ncbi:MAG: hypothetical protein HQL71_09020 [Magnetococcales bacterium]|nr:hypothetical protein [Magnetococcales bacterium]